MHGAVRRTQKTAALFAAASALLAVMAVWVDLRWSRFVRAAEKNP